MYHTHHTANHPTHSQDSVAPASHQPPPTHVYREQDSVYPYHAQGNNHHALDSITRGIHCSRGLARARVALMRSGCALPLATAARPCGCSLPSCKYCCLALLAKSCDVPLYTTGCTPCGCQLPVCQRCREQRLLEYASLGSAPSLLRSERLGGSGCALTPAENRLIVTLHCHLAQQLDGYDDLQLLQKGPFLLTTDFSGLSHKSAVGMR